MPGYIATVLQKYQHPTPINLEHSPHISPPTIYGALHIVLLPLIVLIMKKDIRRAAVNTYVKGKEDDSGEITFEQFQKETGMGVNPG